MGATPNQKRTSQRIAKVPHIYTWSGDVFRLRLPPQVHVHVNLLHGGKSYDPEKLGARGVT